MKFTGTKSYIAGRDLQVAVEAAITLQKPLLIKGEPGTGKTQLAYEIAAALGKKLITWNIKSTTSAQQGLYEYDAISRLRDAQLNSERVSDIRHYIRKGKLWEAFVADDAPVLLIDEIDKADLEFPNDLLQELDKMEFYCYELDETICARQRPIVIITSNNEKELPDAFLRRCFFHYISFPDADTLRKIVEVHYPAQEEQLISKAIALFMEVREKRQLKKRPSTSELIDWIKLLLAGSIGTAELERIDLQEQLPPFAGALLKNEQDLQAILFGSRHRNSYYS
ncbi:MoxR family ATPase [Cesiribacter sp. SM1]|uniref:AAA family ATPase n=1 Tax=Cesiribacter sp. SM1 TaxID=2861196 RepID=UPI001CD5C83C|nr:MoxR family ATPase [Cesiribacter sp. SM1]